MRVNGEGPIPSRIMLVGEAPGAEEERLGLPFVGASGQELNRMLQEAQIMRSECYVTNVCKLRPPNNQISEWIAKAKKDITPLHTLWQGKYVLPQITEGFKELKTEIAMVQPNLIIAFGNIAMLALTGKYGVLKWRGSQLLTDVGDVPIKVIPTIHPAAVLRQWELRQLVVTDLRRAKRQMGSREYDNTPKWNFIIRPTLPQALAVLESLMARLDADEPLWLDLDLETRMGHIACIGISWSLVDAICIPFLTTKTKDGYWSLQEEALIIWWLYKILTHKNVKVRYQNGLFDTQYIYRHWNFIPRGVQDTMISQHSAFAALPKSLAFIASMYCNYYQYWKDDK